MQEDKTAKDLNRGRSNTVIPMTDNFFENQRKKRIKAVQKFLEDKSPIGQDQAIAEISLNWGVGRSTAKDYLKTLRDAKRIEYNEDNEIEWIGDKQ